MHIVLVHQYHHNPDCPATCRHYDFVQRWSARHRVTIISSTAWESRRITTAFRWIPESVDLVRIDVPYRNEMTSFERARAFASFAWKAVQRRGDVETPDVVIGTSPPLSAAWAARRLARIWDVPFVFEVQDLWPDFPIEMGAVPTILHTPLRRLEHSLYRSADCVVVLSPDMQKHVVSAGVQDSRVETLVQGTDIAAAAAAVTTVRGAPQSNPPVSKRTILYAGAFGRANDIRTILAAAEKLAGMPDVRFVFAGQGYHEQTIRRASSTLPNVQLVPPEARHKVFELFASSHLSLVTFADVPSVAAGSPSKLFDSLAAGCPVVVNTAGWIRGLVESNRCGWHVPPENPDALANRIAEILRTPDRLSAARVNGMRLAREHFDRDRLAARFETILESVAGRETTHNSPRPIAEAA